MTVRPEEMAANNISVSVGRYFSVRPELVEGWAEKSGRSLHQIVYASTGIAADALAGRVISGRYFRLNRKRSKQAGVTLVELVLSIVIISVALTGIVSVINLTVSHSADPVVQHQAIAIAESYLEEILPQNYSGTATGNRADFDDVDDYNGLSDTGVHDRQGNAIAALSQYNVAVAISPVALPGGVNAKQVSVTVSGPGVGGLNLVGYRAEY